MPYVRPSSTTQTNSDTRNIIRLRAHVQVGTDTATKKQRPLHTKTTGVHPGNLSTSEDRGGSPNYPSSTVHKNSADVSSSNGPVLTRRPFGEEYRKGEKTSALRQPAQYGSPSQARIATNAKPRKTVHFEQTIECTRYFCKEESPLTIAFSTKVDDINNNIACNCTTGTQWNITLKNAALAHPPLLNKPVNLESLTLSQNLLLEGHVAVANLAFEKHVSLRFSSDNWASMTEATAEYDSSKKARKNEEVDIFRFTINIADNATSMPAKLVLCIRYEVNGQEFWDNNGGEDYHIEFSKEAKTTKEAEGGAPTRNFSNAHNIQRNQRRSTSTKLSGTNVDFHSLGRLPNAEAARPSTPSSSSHLVLYGERKGLSFLNRYDINASLQAVLSHTRTMAKA